MNNLTRYDNNGLELVINTATGEAFASIRATARMTDKAHSTVSRYVNGELKGGAQMVLLQAEINTPGGLQGAVLLNEKQILSVLKKYKPELLVEFAQLGLRMFLHQLAGYEVKSTAVVPPQPKSLNEMLLEEVYAEVDRLAFNSTQAHGVKATIPQYLDELDASSSHTALTGLWMALTRLKLEEGTCNPIQLHRTIHKQLRQVQIKLEGITSVHDSLLTGKELKDKSKALELNPSSKQHLLPEVPTLAH